jgi:rhodanese-related sulfurtransferase
VRGRGRDAPCRRRGGKLEFERLIAPLQDELRLALQNGDRDFMAGLEFDPGRRQRLTVAWRLCGKRRRQLYAGRRAGDEGSLAAKHPVRLADLELAYAPPFSSAKDPVNLLGYMAENVLSGDCDVVDPRELGELLTRGWTLVDVRSAAEHAEGAIPDSINVPIDSLRDHLDALDSRPVVVYCEVGQRGHTAAALMHELGIQARNLDGGYQTWKASMRAQAPEPER